MLRRILISASLILIFLFSTAAPAWALQARNVAVSKVTETTAVLVIKTDTASDVVVDYGSSTGVYTTTKVSNGLTRHEVTLDGLAAGMTVYYRVEIADSAVPATVINIPEKSFRAPRVSGDPFSFTVAGDNRPNSGSASQPAAWSTVVTQMTGEAADLSLSVGDIIYGVNDSAAANVARYEDYFGVTTALTYSSPLYVAAGNHERINAAGARAAFEQEFTLPENNGADAATDGELYYSFDSGDTHFIAVSTEIPGEEGMIINDQKAWLESDLAANTKPWVVVFMHKPLFNGMHAGDPWANTANVAGQQNKADIHGLFLLYGVDIVFAGHEHLYYHHVEDGIHYVITGGGGAPLSTPLPLGTGDIFAASDYHHVKVDESLALLRVSVIDDTDNVLESFTLGEPDLDLSLNSSYWASFSDYVARDLTSSFALTNSGEGDAVNIQMVYLAATSGVTPQTAVPLAVGDIARGGSQALTLVFNVPQGVYSFHAISYATCEDLDGNTYELPGPIPV